ncbi:hypothetical protein AWB71_06009 [Caballeronia peredens]|nr:hypothetical protein AWB71_06009 [Caballeronia peredens]
MDNNTNLSVEEDLNTLFTQYAKKTSPQKDKPKAIGCKCSDTFASLRKLVEKQKSNDKAASHPSKQTTANEDSHPNALPRAVNREIMASIAYSDTETTLDADEYTKSYLKSHNLPSYELDKFQRANMNRLITESDAKAKFRERYETTMFFKSCKPVKRKTSKPIATVIQDFLFECFAALWFFNLLVFPFAIPFLRAMGVDEATVVKAIGMMLFGGVICLVLSSFRFGLKR